MAAAPHRADPAQAEALGQESVTATVNGRTWRAPADVDLWPLSLILASPSVDRFGRPTVNYEAALWAMRVILADQWPEFRRAHKRGDLIDATNAIAAAAGFGVTGEHDRVFGSLPTTLALLTRFPEKVESDLDRFWGIDYLDRWRYDEQGRRKLTLRKIHARLSNLPAESSLAIALGRRSGSELLLMDLWKALTGQSHPSRPLTAEEAAQARSEASALAQARAEYEERRNKDRNRRQRAGEEARRNRAEQIARQREQAPHAEAS